MNIKRDKNDTSTKRYEVLWRHYFFRVEGRKRSTYNPSWEHLKYYDTLAAAKQAVKDFRKGQYQGKCGDYLHLVRYKAVPRWEFAYLDQLAKTV